MIRRTSSGRRRTESPGSGHREVLGIWIEQTEGAKFWLRVMTEIRNRGTHDVLIAVVDGLKGFPEAISAVYPTAQVQTSFTSFAIRCNSPHGRSKLVAAALKPVYRAENAERARERLQEFEAGPWDQKYPAIVQSWRRNWEQQVGRVCDRAGSCGASPWQRLRCGLPLNLSTSAPK